VPSRCSVCEGRLTVQPRTLCDEHKTARAKELARLRARRYRARKAGDPTQALADPNTALITLTPSETRHLADLAVDLPDKENARRAWAARHDAQQLPPVVREYFATAVRGSKALTGLNQTDRYSNRL